MLLRVIPDAEAVTRFDLAGVGQVHTREHPEQCRLACAVEAEHNDLGAAVDGEVDGGEDLQ